MTKYNLEYPAFYNKLYNIMDNEIFSAKYKARFFHLLDLFLQSLWVSIRCLITRILTIEFV